MHEKQKYCNVLLENAHALYQTKAGSNGVFRENLEGTQKTKDHLLLSISDNAKGISDEDMKHLFEPFFSAKAEGNGLGLTTVQNIMHSHKGIILVDSESSKGTTFTPQFPSRNVE
jgi:signal transduction histidine kinase